MMHRQGRPGDEEVSSLFRQDEVRIESKVPPKTHSQNDWITAIFVLLIVVVMSIAFLRTGQQHAKQPTQQISPATVTTADQSSSSGKLAISSQEHARTPKILWVLTGVELEGVRMIEGVVARHLINVGRRSEFEVRVVNSISAYDWLSPEMTERVRLAKHKSKYILQVHELLRIALLIEHGGLSVKLPRYIFPEDFSWLYHLLEQPLDTMIHQQLGVEYCHNDKDAQVVLFYEKGEGGERVFEDWVIFARRKARLLEEAFSEMSELLVSGNWKYKYMDSIEEMDEDVQVKYVRDMFIKLINFKQFYWFTGTTFCTNYQVLAIDKAKSDYYLLLGNKDALKEALLVDKDHFLQKFGRRRMIEANIYDLEFNIAQVLQRQHFGIAHKNSIFRRELIEIAGNEWMTKPVNRTRDVRYCIIALKPLPNNYELLLSQSLGRLEGQTYSNWHAVYFVNGLAEGEVKHSAQVLLANSSKYEGLNLQRAATRFCNLTDVGVLLDFDESFGSQYDLRDIELQMRNRSIYGAFLSYKFSGSIYKPRFGKDGIRRKVMEPSLPLLQEMAYSFRVFSIYAYALIPHMSLHDNSGRYYNRELPFLTLVEMAWDYWRCNDGSMLYHTKQIEQSIDIPKARTAIPNTFIVMPSLREIDIKQHEYISKYAARTLCAAMNLYLDRKGRDMRHFFILNNGSEFVGYQERKQYPQVIEKRIHQMWVGKEMPNFKKFLTNKIKDNHPDYQYFLWTNDNITRENFPVSYDLISTLLEFNKVSKYNKLSMVSDLMRAQIIYNYGGIYLDTNYLVFGKNALDDWLTFDGMFISQLYPFHRFQREGTVFAAKKGYHRLKRLVDHRAISTRNHYSKQAHIEAGPTFFTATVLAQEELDPNILQPSFEHLYPYYPWEDSNHDNLCEAKGNFKQEDLLFRNKKAYWKDCADRYPWAIGMDFWSQGKTWA